jgi:predicted YcjX-like family ATPase
MNIGVWIDNALGLMYFSNDHDPSTKLQFALTKDDHSENAMMLTGWRSNYYLKKMVGAFMNGFLRFDNQVLRNVSYEMFNKMHVA